MLGTEEERAELRRQIDRVHAKVRSAPDDAVAYNAFDPELQLWVAACLYKGIEDVHRLFGSVRRAGARRRRSTRTPSGSAPRCRSPRRCGRRDRAAFEAYWKQELARIEMDDVTRGVPPQRSPDLSFVGGAVSGAHRPAAAVGSSGRSASS